MAIPKTMPAWRKHRGNPEAQYEEIPVPSTPANGFLVKILAAGLCHSDVSVVAHDNASHLQEKFVIGHEGCGEIVQIGDEVKQSEGWKVGRRVAINPVPGCLKSGCGECSRDLMQLCEKGPRLGLGHDGSFAEYIAVPVQCCIPVPDGVSDAEAAVSTDAVMTTHHAIVRRAGITKDDTVFMFGLGGLGFNALQILLHVGCRFFVSETRQEPLDEAKKLGVPEENIVPVGKSVVEWVKEKGLENKIDVVVDIVGVEQTCSDGQMIVRRGGRIINVGLLAPELKINNLLCCVKRLAFLHTFGGHTADIVEGMDLISKGKLSPRVETGELKEFATKLAELHEGKIKSRIALIPESVKAAKFG